MQKQLNEYFSNSLSKFQCSFRQDLSTQHCLLLTIENFRDVKGVFASVLTDLSKAFGLTPTAYRKIWTQFLFCVFENTQKKLSPYSVIV